MKTAYELAMERLAKQSPQVKLTAAQKTRLADLDSRYKAKIAELELGLSDQIANAADSGKREELKELKERLTFERKKLQTELEEKKEQVRQGKRG